MTHPLTDEICLDLMLDKWLDEWNDDGYVMGMRAGYPALRAAADWQLEQVIEWLEYYPIKDVLDTGGYSALIKDFKEAMRPLYPVREHPIREDD